MVRRIYILLFLAAFGIFIVRGTEAFDPESVQGVWLFDEGDGNEVLDSSGKEHHGTITANDVKRVDGKFGDALEFFGGGKVVVPHADGFTTPTFTMNHVKTLWTLRSAVGQWELWMLIANEAFSAGDIQRAMESGLKKFIGGGAAVSASEKLVSAWGAIKAGN